MSKLSYFTEKILYKLAFYNCDLLLQIHYLHYKNYCRGLLECFIYWEEKLYKLNKRIFLSGLLFYTTYLPSKLQVDLKKI